MLSDWDHEMSDDMNDEESTILKLDLGTYERDWSWRRKKDEKEPEMHNARLKCPQFAPEIVTDD